jgi:phosphatidylglycerophosphatase A
MNGLSAAPSLRVLILAVASVGFLSYIPYRVVPHAKWKGGGLLGSLAGWGLLWTVPAHGLILWALTFALLFFAVFVSHYAEIWMGEPDDPRIIIDEVAGVWIAALWVPRELGPTLAALILFRFFDVFKGPWGRWASRAPGGWGVVADDIVAGFIAGGLAWVLTRCTPFFH